MISHLLDSDWLADYLNGLTLITRNSKDFRRIPGLKLQRQG